MSLHENFEKAAADAKSFAKRPSDDVLLQLYGLYKQAISGDNTSGTEEVFSSQLISSCLTLPIKYDRGTLGHPVRSQG